MNAIDLDIGVYNMRICIISNNSYDVYFIYKCNKYAIYNKHEVCGCFCILFIYIYNV